MKLFSKIAIFICLCLVLTMCVVGGFTVQNVANAESYIETTEELMRALQGGQSKIYVGDISFETPTEIQLNYPVEIIGRAEKSTIENAHFKIVGPNVADENIDIAFKNIIFDGKVDKTVLNLEENKTFDEIFGETPQYRCIDGCIGYYTLSIDNSEIRNYLCEEGPAIYINNNANYLAGKKVLNLTNTKVYNNISNLGTVKVFSDKLTTNIDNCEFYGNLARAGQGIAVGNGKSEILNTTIHDNDFFRFVNPMERKYPSIFQGDKQTFKGVTTHALGSCCGVLFIGGSNTIVDNCKIYNNKTIFGGGIGIINAQTQIAGEKIEIKNTDIINNEAVLCGGGIYVQSNQGETTYFTNCNILGNKAGENGSIIYTTTYSPDSDKSYGGKVQFTFCTMVGNEATDARTFTFYDLLKPELSGFIELYGCFVIDESPYSENGAQYDYIATIGNAIADGVVTEEMLKDLSNGIAPIKGSVADIKVSPEVYTTWIGGDASTLSDRNIGVLIVEKEEDTFPYWVIVFPVLAVVGIIVGIIVYRKKRVKKNAVNEEMSVTPEQVEDAVIKDYTNVPYEELLRWVSEIYEDKGLTDKEIEIATLMLQIDRRKEIAERLVVSDETVKTHVSRILKKVGVSSRQEFKEQTTKLLNK